MAWITASRMAIAFGPRRIFRFRMMQKLDRMGHDWLCRTPSAHGELISWSFSSDRNVRHTRQRLGAMQQEGIRHAEQRRRNAGEHGAGSRNWARRLLRVDRSRDELAVRGDRLAIQAAGKVAPEWRQGIA